MKKRNKKGLRRRYGHAEGSDSGYGAVLHRSPKPMAVVGYFYESWSRQGPRREIYRVEVSESTYRAAVRRIERSGHTSKDKDAMLFRAFLPSGVTVSA